MLVVFRNYSRFVRCPVRPESFRPDLESFCPQYEVVSPGLRVHTYTCVCGRLFYNEEYSQNFFVCLFVSDSSLDRSEKILNLTCFSLFLDPVEKDSGESTLSPGETTPGEQDIGRNNLLPSVAVFLCYIVKY